MTIECILPKLSIADASKLELGKALFLVEDLVLFRALPFLPGGGLVIVEKIFIGKWGHKLVNLIFWICEASVFLSASSK